MNLVKSIFREHSSTNGRLVGYQYNCKAGAAELLEGFSGSRQEANQRGITKIMNMLDQRAVTIEKNSRPLQCLGILPRIVPGKVLRASC